MIGSLKTVCKSDGCSYETVVGELKVHWRKCDFRAYSCAICNKVVNGRVEFLTHVNETHENKILSYFD